MACCSYRIVQGDWRCQVDDLDGIKRYVIVIFFMLLFYYF